MASDPPCVSPSLQIPRRLRLKGPREAARYLVECSRKRWAAYCGDYCGDLSLLGLVKLIFPSFADYINANRVAVTR